jgi:hypothetical protein
MEGHLIVGDLLSEEVAAQASDHQLIWAEFRRYCAL